MEMPPVFKSISYCISTVTQAWMLQIQTKIVVALGVTITQGEGNLPKLFLTSDHGSEAEIYLFGDCITSWKDMVFQWWKVTEEESQKEEEEEQRHGISMAKNQTPPN